MGYRERKLHSNITAGIDSTTTEMLLLILRLFWWDLSSGQVTL